MIGDEVVFVVCVYVGCVYYVNNFELLMCELARFGVDAIGRVVGGGRCECDDVVKMIKVYGYSKMFGCMLGCNECVCVMI